METIFSTLFVCSALVTITFMVLLSLPQSKLRSVCLELFQYVLAAGLILLTLSPVDMVPDLFFPVGFVDDLGYIAAAIATIKSAREKATSRKNIS